MSQTTHPNFNLVVPITGYTIRKCADGVERPVLTGLASNTNIDAHGERMSQSAITAMEKSLEENEVMLNNEHGRSWDDDFGQVTRLWSTSGSDLMMEAELDPDHYRTQTLIKALNKGKKLGLSIGGAVKDAAYEFAEELGRKVLTFKDVTLFHVAITGSPAVADTWVTPITKSMKDWKDTPMSDTTKTEDQIETNKEEVIDTPAAEEAETEVVEPVEDVTTEETAEGDEPEAPETETPTPSDSEDTDEVVEENTDPETASTPAEPEAPTQEDESPASEKSAPESAEEGTSEVEKSAVFGDWAEIDLIAESIEQLSWTLRSHVWSVMYNEAIESSEKLASIAAGLDDYKSLILKVATALIDAGDTDAIKSAHEAFQAQTPETVSKSLAEKDTQVQELTKSLATAQEELETVKSELAEKSGELETTTEALEEATTEIEKRDARKAQAFAGFDVEKTETTKSSDSVASTWYSKLASLDKDK